MSDKETAAIHWVIFQLLIVETWGWIKPKSGTRNSIQFSHVTGTWVLELSLLFLKLYISNKLELRVQVGLEPRHFDPECSINGHLNQ